MVIAGFSKNGKLKIRKVEKNVKINSDYYQKYVLTPIFKKYIPSLYPNNLQCVKFHQDRASSHTSTSTALFFVKMRNETEIEAIPFKCIPLKSSDVSTMDYLHLVF